MRPSSALRCASAARVGAAGRGTRRPQRGDELVEVRAAQRGRALHELEPVGEKTLTSGRSATSTQALDGRAVVAHALWARPADAEADSELVRRRRRRDRLSGPAQRARAEAHQLAVVAGAQRAAGAAEVEGLEQVGLAGAVRPVDHGQAARRARRRRAHSERKSRSAMRSTRTAGITC